MESSLTKSIFCYEQAQQWGGSRVLSRPKILNAWRSGPLRSYNDINGSEEIVCWNSHCPCWMLSGPRRRLWEQLAIQSLLRVIADSEPQHLYGVSSHYPSQPSIMAGRIQDPFLLWVLTDQNYPYPLFQDYTDTFKEVFLWRRLPSLDLRSVQTVFTIPLLLIQLAERSHQLECFLRFEKQTNGKKILCVFSSLTVVC